MLASQRVMEIALQTNYSITSKTRKRYSELLVARAVRFYIENQLDSGVVEEDLYNWEDYGNDLAIKQEQEKDPFPNLDYAEKEEIKWQREQSKILKQVSKL